MAKRGRPRFEEDELLTFLGTNVFPDIKTRRHLQNKVYQSRALEVIGQLDKEGWDMRLFFDREKKTMRSGVLVEMGRLLFPDLIREWAIELSKKPEVQNMTVKQLAKYIRELRLYLFRKRVPKTPEPSDGFQFSLTQEQIDFLQRLFEELEEGSRYPAILKGKEGKIKLNAVHVDLLDQLLDYLRSDSGY